MKKIQAALLFFLLSFSTAFPQCWVSIDAGAGFNLGVAVNGTLWAWGVNNAGQLGDGTNVDKSSPVQIGTATNWVKVSAGFDTSYAIKADGSLWAWGRNDYGQVGDNTTITKFVPIHIGTATWVFVVGGEKGVLAIKTDGSLWGWGRNDIGQLGIGNQTDKKIPTRVGLATNWVKADMNTTVSAAINTDGTLWTWGKNSAGQLGDNSPGNFIRTSPVQVGSATWNSVGCGGGFIVAIKSDGTIWSSGTNYAGELGLGLPTGFGNAVLVLTQIGTDADWQMVSTATYYSKAIKTNGLLYSWGSVPGRFTGSVVTSSNIPNVETSQTWKFVSTGTIHNIQVTTDDIVWMLGNNGSGALGNGTVDPVANNSHVYLLNCPIALNTTDAASEKEFVIYPNPAIAQLHIANPLQKQFTAVVSDLTGKSLLHCDSCENIMLDQLSAGTYFIKINSEDSSSVFKFIKK